MQSFPFDQFDTAFLDLVQRAADDCVDVSAGWRAYAAAFYYYNRLIQSGLNDPITVDEVGAWDELTSVVQAAVIGCDIGNATIDAAILDYGRATVYNWSNDIPNDLALQAADDFLGVVEGRETDYYLQSHVKKMLQFSDM